MGDTTDVFRELFVYAYALSVDTPYSPTISVSTFKDASDFPAAPHHTGSPSSSDSADSSDSPLDVLVSEDPFADPIDVSVVEDASSVGSVYVIPHTVQDAVQAIAEAEVAENRDQVAWALRAFEAMCDVLRGDMCGVSDAIALAYDRARSENSSAADAAAPVRENALSLVEERFDGARATLASLSTKAHTTLWRQRHAAWDRCALLGDDLRSALPTYALVGPEPPAQTNSAGFDIVDVVFEAFWRRLQSVVDAVVVGLTSLYHSNDGDEVHLETMYDASADALDTAIAAARASIEVLAAYARDAIYRQFTAALQGRALGCNGARSVLSDPAPAYDAGSTGTSGLA